MGGVELILPNRVHTLCIARLDRETQFAPPLFWSRRFKILNSEY